MQLLGKIRIMANKSLKINYKLHKTRIRKTNSNYIASFKNKQKYKNVKTRKSQ